MQWAYSVHSIGSTVVLPAYAITKICPATAMGLTDTSCQAECRSVAGKNTMNYFALLLAAQLRQICLAALPLLQRPCMLLGDIICVCWSESSEDKAKLHDREASEFLSSWVWFIWQQVPLFGNRANLAQAVLLTLYTQSISVQWLS